MKALIPIISFFLFFNSINGQSVKEFPESDNSTIGYIENKGQIHDGRYHPRTDVICMGTGASHQLIITDQGPIHQWMNANAPALSETAEHNNSKNGTIEQIQLQWMNSNPVKEIIFEDAYPGELNYLNLSYAPEGILGVKKYRKCRLVELYTGIDVVFRGEGNQYEYDYYVFPNGDYKDIEFTIKNAVTCMNPDGNLWVESDEKSFELSIPRIMQLNNVIAGNWEQRGENKWGFKIAEYNPSLPLVIDPLVREWGTYFGGSRGDETSGVESDPQGNSYIYGITISSDQIANNGTSIDTSGHEDAFLAKFAPNGTLIWGTYLGGDYEDIINDAEITITGELLVFGTTESTTGIATVGAQQTTNLGWPDAFLMKIDASGNRIWGTYLGSNSPEYGKLVRQDNAGNIFVAGNTNSNIPGGLIFPPSPHQNTFGGVTDGFLCKYNSSGTLMWGTYYGGSQKDEVNDLQVSATGQIYLVGTTQSTNNISSAGSHQANYQGSTDVFIAKFNTAGQRIWGTYFGGNNMDSSPKICLLPSGNFFVGGRTMSTQGIATPNGWRDSILGSNDIFIAKFNPFSNQIWGTYFGDPDSEDFSAMAFDGDHRILIGGTSSHNNWSQIITLGAFQPWTFAVNPISIIARMDTSLKIDYVTHYGGPNTYITGISWSYPYYWVAGNTINSSNISTPGSHKPVYFNNIDGRDGFLVKFEDCNEYYSYTDTFCVRFFSPTGQTITQSGDYLFAYPTSPGCDSMVYLDLTIEPLDTSVFNGGTYLTANGTGTYYEWLDCMNGTQAVPGANSQTFYPTYPSRYALAITVDGCTDTSFCHGITAVNVEDGQRLDPIFDVYPNPSNGDFFITLSPALVNQEIAWEVRDLQGRLVQEAVKRGMTGQTIAIQNNGIYFLTIRFEGGSQTRKLVKF